MIPPLKDLQNPKLCPEPDNKCWVLVLDADERLWPADFSWLQYCLALPLQKEAFEVRVQSDFSFGGSPDRPG